MYIMLVGNIFLVRGDAGVMPALFEVLAENGIDTDGNPDIYRRVYSHFGIDEARELSERAYGKSMTGGKRVFILSISAITNEAQNALLKTLEEPPAGALFFLIVPSPEMLLATLRSRTQVLELAGDVSESAIDPKAFLASSPRSRLELIKPLLEKGDDDRRDVSSVITFLSSLERILAKHTDAGRDGIDAIYVARKYAGDKGALLKPLLEQVALLAPVI